jgi:AraC family transcriptional regulator of adaptative response/methylated-DNA-[protein]-cysteine methyltransferase
MPGDYARIEKALAFIVENAERQPGLEELAAACGLSPFHFQRIFTRWVGISPKKFLQHVTLERAKARLAGSESVLDAAFAVGLSAPSRLHDLFVAHEAVTPGEFKLRGEGLEIAHGWADSPFGEALILTTRRGICGLAFELEAGREATLADMTRRWPRARFVEDRKAMTAVARRVFAPRAGDRVELVLHGSPFQVKVWEALLRIPPGALASYARVAQAALGAPRGMRAVGAAVGANPISYLVPCHRVVRGTGELNQYHWGRARKLALIGWEAGRAEGAGTAGD